VNRTHLGADPAFNDRVGRLHPEWAGYLAAFQAYIDAIARNDPEHARQAQVLMGYFADALLPMTAHRNAHTDKQLNLGALIDMLGLSMDDAA
jgi:hypothetical protein